MREIKIEGSNIVITPKIEDEKIIKRLQNLSNVYLVRNNNSSTTICLLNNPTIKINGILYEDKIQMLEIIKTRNIIPKLLQ